MHLINKKNAFSLCEMIIAIALFGLVIVTVCSVFIHGFNAIKKGKEIAIAVHLINKKFDEISNLELDIPSGISKNNLCSNIEGYSPASITPDNNYVSWSASGYQEIEGTEIIADKEYTFFIKIESYKDNIKKISIEVTFTSDNIGIQKLRQTGFLARKATI